jgi:N-acetylmuramoyl-L-alanine amidase
VNYEIKQQFITYNRPKTTLLPVGIVVHETATPGATAQSEYIYFNGGNRKASAHAFVDWMEIIQTIPWTEQAWHAGPTANEKYLGIELCRPSTHDPAKFQEVWNRGVWLFAWLFLNILKKDRVTRDNLMSHAEVSAKWHESDHADPVSYFAEYGKTVDGFRAEVQRKINEMKGETEMVIYKTLEDVPEWGRPVIQKLIGRGSIKGDGQGNITLSEDAVKILVILDREGVLK